MSKLGDAVSTALTSRHVTIDKLRIEKVLSEAGVSDTASRGVPSRLRIRHLKVTGTRTFKVGDKPDAPTVAEPISLDWSPQDGVNGVGSERNFRGKSSVIHFSMWALTGRSHLQDDVAEWVDHVSAEIHVDLNVLHVEFDVKDGVPSGTVAQQAVASRAVLGSFNGNDEFEAVMGSVMLSRLRLEVIPVFADGVETAHMWPTYASSLTVSAHKLDPIIGNENTVKTRMLQMFVGTSWAATDAQVTTALNALNFERTQRDAARGASASVSATQLTLAEDRLARVKARLAEFDPSEPNVDAVYASAAAAAEAGRTAHDLAMQLMTADAGAERAHRELRVELQRQHAAAENAVAQVLFNGMMPTACPRCLSAVTAERYVAEVDDHHCSVCSSDLLTLTSAHEQPEALVGEDGEDGDEEEDVSVALAAVVAEAEGHVAALSAQLEVAQAAQSDAEARMRQAQSRMEQARARTAAENEVIAAQAVLNTLRELGGAGSPSPPPNGVDVELQVLQAASGLVKTWVKEDQDPLLLEVSKVIVTLARAFGFPQLEKVDLKGNGNMRVTKGGGVETGYSGLTPGEKLRIKLATAIALIQIGHSDGVGRHPGLLFVDSPAAEEVPEEDLRIMLEALVSVAEETEMQIVVATRHAAVLDSVLAPDHLLLAFGDDYVW